MIESTSATATTASAIFVEVTDPIQAAAAEYLRRRDRLSHPDGTFDRKSRWYPSDAEAQSCCTHIRYPSAAFPYSYMTHCRTTEHVANLYGAAPLAVKRAAKAIETAR